MSSILITGASKGIGRATAVELARRGHRVVATARDPHTLDDLDVDQRLRLDVPTRPASMPPSRRLARSTSSSRTPASSSSRPSRPARSPRSSASTPRTPSGRSASPRRSSRRCARARRVGCCSCPASPGASCRPPAAYAATKWALEAFAEALAIELGGFGIDVTLAEPGPVSSGALDDMPAYRLPDDPYAALFAHGGHPTEIMISPDRSLRRSRISWSSPPFRYEYRSGPWRSASSPLGRPPPTTSRSSLVSLGRPALSTRVGRPPTRSRRWATRPPPLWRPWG